MLITKLTRKIEELAARSRLVYSLTALYYRRMVQREAQLAQIGPEDKVLCIGGGICPYTAILLREYTGAEVTVMDNDPRCVEQCCRFLRGRGLDRIGVQFGCGTAVHCGDYTVIHLALQVSPREEVLRSVLAQARAGTRILVRVPKASLQGLYCPAGEGPFSVNAGFSTESFPTWTARLSWWHLGQKRRWQHDGAS